ncbi:MAG: helix-turn-helix transcriptional regulator [Maritimibacter sp.]
MPHRKVKDWTQVMPFEGATEVEFKIARSFGLINAWNAALSGNFEMKRVCEIMASQAGAVNISVFRQDAQKTRSIVAVAREHMRRVPEASQGRLCAFFKEVDPNRLTQGTIMTLSGLKDDPLFAASDVCKEWESRPEVHDFIVIILEHTPKYIDAIEFIFEEEPLYNDFVPATVMAQAIAAAWDNRSPGLVSNLIRSNSRARAPVITDIEEGILGDGNPCGLSRAELRVCRLLVEGDNASEIAETLKVSVATVRTHLSKIYAKTGTSGQVELISVIHGEGEAV